MRPLYKTLGWESNKSTRNCKNICLEMQSLKQDRTPRLEACEEIWCIKCKGQGHDKDNCLVFMNYLVGGGSMPLIPKE